MQIDLKNSPLLNCLSLLVIKYLYMFLAVNILEPYWFPGTGSYKIDFDPSKEIIASIVFIAVVLIYTLRGKKSIFHDTLLHLIMVLYYIPTNSSYSINNLPTQFFVLTNCYCIILIMLLSKFLRSNNRSCLLPEKTNEMQLSSVANDIPDLMLLRIFFFIICTAFIIYKLSYNGLSFSISIDTGNVYETRSDYVVYRTAIAGSFISYIISAFTSLAGIVAPVYFYMSLVKKRILPVIISLLCVLSEYSMFSEKSSLFFLAIVIFIYFLQKKDIIKSFKSIFNFGMIIILFLCWLAWHWKKADGFFMVFIRREMFVPSWISSMYYDFFSRNQNLLFGDSVFLLQRVFPNPYGKLTVLELINSEYFMGTLPHPNTGLFAEAYMHLGPSGIVIFPLLIICPIVNYMYKAYAPFGDGICILLGTKTALSMINVPVIRTDFILSHILLLFVFLFVEKLSLDEILIRESRVQKQATPTVLQWL